MSVWRTVGAVVILLAAVPVSQAQTHALAETVQAGDCFQIRLDLSLAGEIRIQQDGKITPLKLEASAKHEFPERVLAVGKTGLAEKTARVYETAKVVITRGKERNEMSLRPERRLFVSQRFKDQPLVYCPAGALYREELEVTEHFDTLAVIGLLPGKAVAVGDTWKVHTSVVQAVCNFEGLTEQSLTGKLEEVKDQVAVFSVTGSATGIDLGALAKINVQATGRFDLASKRLVELVWKQKDERDQGPASPASVVEATTTLKRTAIKQPAALSDVALISVPSDEKVPPPLTQLDYRDPKGRFDLLHGREWQVVAQTEKHVVMRLLERGDFVAQVTIAPWTAAEKGKHLAPEDFKEAMNQIPGWEPEKELQAGEVPAEEGHWIYRLSVQGQMDGVAVLQNFYLVAGPGGEQVVLTFTMTPKQVDKLGARDLALVGSLAVPATSKK
jgi:hypothetical protein